MAMFMQELKIAEREAAVWASPVGRDNEDSCQGLAEAKPMLPHVY